MNSINRAIKYIKRNITKSVLIALLFFIVGNVSIIGIGLSNAAVNAQIVTKNQMRAVIEFKYDHFNFNKNVNELGTEDDKMAYMDKYMNYITKDDIDIFSSDDRIKAMDVIYNQNWYASTFNSVPMDNDGDHSNYNEMGEPIAPNILIKGGLNTNSIDFADENFVMIDGNMYTQNDIDNANNVCLITDTLADLNGFKVGDIITIDTLKTRDLQEGFNQYGEMSFDMCQIDVKIIGIYDNKKETDKNNILDYEWVSGNRSNENVILMPATTIFNKYKQMIQIKNIEYQKTHPEGLIEEINEELSFTSVVILMNDIEDIPSFIEDYSDKFDNELFIFDANMDDYDKLVIPLKMLSVFSKIILIIIFINAIVIITLVATLSIKSREYEIGVLLSIGVSKLKIICQLFMEYFIIAIIIFSMSSITGTLIANKISQNILDFQLTVYNVDDNQIDSDGEQYWNDRNNNYFTKVTLNDVKEVYVVDISLITIIKIYLICLSIVSLSIIIPTMIILKYNPKTILTRSN